MGGVELNFEEMCIVMHILNVIAPDIVRNDDPRDIKGRYYTANRSYVSMSEKEFSALVSAMEKMGAFTAEGLKKLLPKKEDVADVG